MRASHDLSLLPSARRRVIACGLWSLVALTVLHFVSLLPAVRASLGDLPFDEVLQDTVYLLGAAVVAARAAMDRRARLAWALLACGLFAYFGGNVYWYAVLQHLDPMPYPSLADAMWLSFYPFAYAAVILLLRRQIVRWHASMWLDGLVGALGVGAVAVTFVFHRVLLGSEGGFAVVAVNLAYPVVDLLLITLVVGVFAILGWRPTRTWRMLATGVVIFCIADVVYLLQVAAESYESGTWLDGLWLAGITALASAAWSREEERVRASLEGWVLLVIPMTFAFLSVGLLVLGNAGDDLSWLATALAAATIVVALLRTMLTFREVQALADARRQARTDELTGLSNRRHYLEQVEQALADREDGERLAVLLIDLDRFKEINDSFGHHMGDQLLRMVGPRLQDQLRPGDIVARLGGDEFGLVLPGADVARATAVAHSINSRLREPFLLDGMPLRIDGSVGIALCPQHGVGSAQLLQHADVAMYTAKHGHMGYAVYEPGGSSDSRLRLQTLEELRVALGTDQLVLHYQPKLDLRTRAVTGVEALVRWDHPRRGLVYPDAFLPIAEQAGLMRRIALLVLERALYDVRDWRAQGHELTVAVNLSVSNLQDVGLPQQVEMLLDSIGVPAAALTLEITENVLMADADRAHQVLAGLRRLGVTLSVDDYGTGYSSLAYLQALPVQELKLDRSFVSHLNSDDRAAAIVESTVDLAHRLGMRMVAEGVENRQVLDQLAAWGCDTGQGYHIARPMSVERFSAWLLDRASEREEWAATAR